MATSLYFTTGQAAHQLGASQAQIRALCESGAVESESTRGGQYRIPAGEVERLKRAGLPTMPRPLPQEGAPAARSGHMRHGHPQLLADPSEIAVTAAEDVVVSENLLRKRRIELELAEVDDQFKAREIAEAQRRAERERADRTRLEEEGRTDWLRQAEESALRLIHPGVPAEMRLAALEAVRLRLETLTPIPSPKVTAEIVVATLELALGSWIRFADLATMADEVRARLPWELRESPEVRSAAVRAAVPAMHELLTGNINAGLGDLRAAAAAPVQTVVSAFRHERRCQRLLADRWWLRLPDVSTEEQSRAKAAVAHVLRELPATASDRDLDVARDFALRPFHAAVNQARAEQRARAEAEARRLHERNYRDSLVQPICLFAYDLSGADGEQALAAIREALDTLPQGTPEGDLAAARDRAVRPYLDARARRARPTGISDFGLG
jgi:excisionase family DNA binding protein